MENIYKIMFAAGLVYTVISLVLTGVMGVSHLSSHIGGHDLGSHDFGNHHSTDNTHGGGHDTMGSHNFPGFWYW